MAEVTAKMVNELRQRTGVGMMDCKKALVTCEGDVEMAIDELRKKGLAKAASKADRAANEGLIRIHKVDDRHASMVLINCETDFVSKNEQFVEFVEGVAKELATASAPPAAVLGKAARGEELSSVRDFGAAGNTIGDQVTDRTVKTGENVQLGAIVVEQSETPEDFLQDYLHGLRVGVMVCLTTGKAETQSNPRFRELAKDIAMQVAAAVPSAPLSVSREDVDPAVIEREKSVLLEQAKEETAGPNFKGNLEEIAEKKVTGRLNKFYEENVLLEQPFIKDDKSKVRDYIASVEKELGDTVKVARFHRFQLGA